MASTHPRPHPDLLGSPPRTRRARFARATRLITWLPILLALIPAAAGWRWSSRFMDDDHPCNIDELCLDTSADLHLTMLSCAAFLLCLVSLVGEAMRHAGLPARPDSPQDQPLRLGRHITRHTGVVLVAVAILGVVWLPVLLVSMFVVSEVVAVPLVALLVLLVIRALEVVGRRTWPGRSARSIHRDAWFVVGTTLLALEAQATPHPDGPLDPLTDVWTQSPWVTGVVASVAAAGATATADLLTVWAARRHGRRSMVLSWLTALALAPSMLYLGISTIVTIVLLMLSVPDDTSSRPPVAPAPRAATPTSPPPSTRPTRSTPPRGVPAEQPCRPADLDWVNEGWDATMGKTSTAVRVTNRTTTPCYVDGFADVRITQGGKEIRLAQAGGSSEVVGQPGSSRRVGIAPGNSARTTLWWRGYRTAADQHTPQRLYVDLGPGPRTEIPLDAEAGPAPFDLIDGGTILIGAWSAS